jgi:hypothetical protein
MLSYMQPNDAQSQRVTVKQAAKLLGVTPEAVRARLFRGTLEREEGDDGTVCVRLHANQLRSDADQSGAQAPLAPYLERLLDEVAHLRQLLYEADERARENRRIIAALRSSIPELPPPPAQEEPSPQQRASDTRQYAVTPTPQAGRET